MAAGDILGAGGVGSAPQDAANRAEMARQKQRLDDLKHRLGGKNSEKELRAVCTDFEAMFMGKLWEQMQNSIPKEGYLHSRYEEQYMSMFNTELSKKLANAGGIGIADMMYNQLSTQLKAKEQAKGEPLPIRPLQSRDVLPGQPGLPETAMAAAAPAEEAARYADPAALSQGEADRRAAGLAARIVSAEGTASVPAASAEDGKALANSPGRNGGPGRIVPAEETAAGLRLRRDQVRQLKSGAEKTSEG